MTLERIVRRRKERRIVRRRMGRDSGRVRNIGRDKRDQKREDRERRHLQGDEFNGGETIDEAPINRSGEHTISKIRQKNNDFSISRLSPLSTGKLYVQARNNFQAIKILPSTAPSVIRTDQAHSTQISRRQLPIIFAILLQRFFYSLGFISRGFLAGMALTHSLMIHIFFAEPSKIQLDPLLVSRISDLYNSIFWSLLVLCLTSVFDKIRSSSDGACFWEVAAVIHGKSLLALPFYLIVLALQLISSKLDTHYVANFTNASSTAAAGHFATWRRIANTKDASAILAWLLECFDIHPHPDAFLHNLEGMSKG